MQVNASEAYMTTALRGDSMEAVGGADRDACLGGNIDMTTELQSIAHTK